MPICLFHRKPLEQEGTIGPICSFCLEEAAMKCLQNFAPGDAYYCGHCGNKFDLEGMTEHGIKYPYGTCY